ncbi:MAG: amidase family protein [Proteobacteria bacterium]|nr:amidase family protein [Pseudomonadota bacterium]
MVEGRPGSIAAQAPADPLSPPPSVQRAPARRRLDRKPDPIPAATDLASELWRLDATALAGLIRCGKVSSRETVDSCLGRLAEVNPRLNAVVLTLADEARAAASHADQALRRGRAIGPLHGVPVTIKVNCDQRGCPTDNGVVAYRDIVASEDNPVVANLRRAGAVLIGRTNTPAYSMRWFTDNELHGRTLNPWDAGRTPGGSSGGAAASVASGIGPIAHGNDIGGSIRYPAYCCGIFGLRPSFGRVPSFNGTAKGPNPISSQLMAVQGPLARSVRDLRLAFAAMAVADIRDPRCVEVVTPTAPPRPIRVALVANPGGRGIHRAVAEALTRVGDRLSQAGYAVTEIEPPGLIEAAELWPKLAMGDVIAQIEPLIAQNGDAAIKRAVALWRGVWPSGSPAACLTALGERIRLLRQWQHFFERYPVIIMPTSTELPFEVDADLRDEATTAQIIAAQGSMLAVSVLGLPAISVPTGLHQGMPVGVQIVAGLYREDLCFDAAEVVETHLPMPTPIDLRA